MSTAPISIVLLVLTMAGEYKPPSGLQGIHVGASFMPMPSNEVCHQLGPGIAQFAEWTVKDLVTRVLGRDVDELEIEFRFECVLFEAEAGAGEAP